MDLDTDTTESDAKPTKSKRKTAPTEQSKDVEMIEAPPVAEPTESKKQKSKKNKKSKKQKQKCELFQNNVSICKLFELLFFKVE